MNTVFIDFNDIVLKNTKETNWKAPETLSSFLDCVFDNPFFKIEYYLSTENNKIPITKDKLKSKIIKDGEYNVDLYSKEKLDEERLVLSFSEFEEERLRFFFKIIYSENTVTLDKINNYLWSILKKIKDVTYFGPSISVTFREDLDFPRVRPMKFYGFLSEFAIINIFDKEYFKNFTYGYEIPKKDMINFIKTIEDDKGLNLTVQDNFVGVTWVNSMKTKDLEKGMSFREDFINTHLKLPNAHGFNEFGDMELFHVTQFEKLSSTEYFNYYSERNGIGFKLIVLGEGMQLSDEDKTEIKKYYKSKALKDGREIKKIVPVVPSREYVLELKKVPKEVGIYKSLYIDDELNLWDVDPVGNWKN